VSRLFAAGVFPGLLMALLFSAYVVLRCAVDPTIAPGSGVVAGLGARLRSLRELLPTMFLIAMVLGTIYSGIATPNEAATVGLAATLALVSATRQLTWTMLHQALMATVNITSMIGAIIVFASFMSSAVAYLHLPQSVNAAFQAWQLGPYQLIACLAVFYILLGCVLDGLSILVLTLPLTLPLVVAAGFDPIWYGVFMVMVVEIGLVTPPVGMNLYVLQGLTGYSMSRIAWASLPFCLLMILAMAIVTIVPGIALWLPGFLYDR
jgi:tripartite ATP-independent transporter DctM subunit